MSYGPQTRHPIEHDETPLDDPTAFACACGDAACRGRDDDPANIRIGSASYAAACVLANHHPLVIESRERDAMNERRR